MFVISAISFENHLGIVFRVSKVGVCWIVILVVVSVNDVLIVWNSVICG